MAKPACRRELRRVVGVDDLKKPAVANTGGPVIRCWEVDLMDEALAGLDPDKRYAEDPRWVGEIELTLSEYMAGGFGDLVSDDELRGLFDEFEGFYTDAEEDEAPPEGLVRRYVELAFARRLRSLST